jgi:hypothetical protein
VLEARISKSSLGTLSSTIKIAVNSINSGWAKVGYAPASGGNGANYVIGSASGRMEMTSDLVDEDISKGISIYPNPAKSLVNIEYVTKTESLVSIDLFDLSGRHISNSEKQIKPAGRYKKEVDVNTPGIFILKVFKDGRFENRLIRIE